MRYFNSKITPDQLAEKILKAAKRSRILYEDDYAHCTNPEYELSIQEQAICFRFLLVSLTAVIEKDLLKVAFDLENCEFEKHPHDEKMNQLLGFQTLANGLTFLGGYAGGDWEQPVYFLIYWDGNKLRGYIPTKGNPWNTDNKEAYGNDPDSDLINCKKRFPEYDNITEECNVPWNTEQLLQDITNHILFKGGDQDV